MLSTKFAVGLLGIGLTFTPDPLYDYYEQRAPIWGLTAGGDQELAGAIMALEQSIVMGIALAYLFIRALEQSEREQRRARERLEDLREAGRLSGRSAGEHAVVGQDDRVLAGVDRDVPLGRRRRAPKRTSPRTVSASQATSEGGAGREARLEVVDQLVVAGSSSASGGDAARARAHERTRDRSSST